MRFRTTGRRKEESLANACHSERSVSEVKNLNLSERMAWDLSPSFEMTSVLF